jgi:hypothetical protein
MNFPQVLLACRSNLPRMILSNLQLPNLCSRVSAIHSASTKKAQAKLEHVFDNINHLRLATGDAKIELSLVFLSSLQQLAEKKISAPTAQPSFGAKTIFSYYYIHTQYYVLVPRSVGPHRKWQSAPPVFRKMWISTLFTEEALRERHVHR